MDTRDITLLTLLKFLVYTVYAASQSLKIYRMPNRNPCLRGSPCHQSGPRNVVYRSM